MGKLIRDGNQVYEIDEECIRERERKEREQQTEQKETSSGYRQKQDNYKNLLVNNRKNDYNNY